MSEKVILNKMSKDFELKSSSEFNQNENFKHRHENSNLNLKDRDFYNEISDALEFYKERLDRLGKDAVYRVQKYRAGSMAMTNKRDNIDNSLLLKIIEDKDAIYRDFRDLLNEAKSNRFILSKSDTRDINLIYSFILETETKLTNLLNKL